MYVCRRAQEKWRKLFDTCCVFTCAAAYNSVFREATIIAEEIGLNPEAFVASYHASLCETYIIDPALLFHLTSASEKRHSYIVIIAALYRSQLARVFSLISVMRFFPRGPRLPKGGLYTLRHAINIAAV